ncbi:hypothetical protein HY498_02855 [Candidatus Woesearchaeota archaeon]|nr:hypothetical protein [Candidatus Woesearchaeota archaeon]
MNKVIYEGYANGFYSFQNFSNFLKSLPEVNIVRSRNISDMENYIIAHLGDVTLEYIIPILNGSLDRRLNVVIRLYGSESKICDVINRVEESALKFSEGLECKVLN